MIMHDWGKAGKMPQPYLRAAAVGRGGVGDLESKRKAGRNISGNLFLLFFSKRRNCEIAKIAQVCS